MFKIHELVVTVFHSFRKYFKRPPTGMFTFMHRASGFLSKPDGSSIASSVTSGCPCSSHGWCPPLLELLLVNNLPCFVPR